MRARCAGDLPPWTRCAREATRAWAGTPSGRRSTRIARLTKRLAGRIDGAETGSIGCPQRFGGALNVNPHLHTLELVPLIRTLDNRRSQQVMTRVLERVASDGSQVVLLDITGVPAIDHDTARHLLKTITAARNRF